jgi:DNA-binding Xre family transcriptional regulator
MKRPKNLSDWRWRIAKAGLREYDAAKEIGITATALSRILTGKVKPLELTVAKIESFLKSKGV